MSKNDRLINNLAKIAARNRAEHVRMASERDTPAIYAVMAMTLWEFIELADDDKVELISRMFARSQDIWIDAAEAGDDVVLLCKELTGIDVMGRVSDV